MIQDAGYRIGYRGNSCAECGTKGLDAGGQALVQSSKFKCKVRCSVRGGVRRVASFNTRERVS